jgi:hypothetical protein
VEAPFLLLVAHREPVLDQRDSGTDEHSFKFRAAVQKFLVFALAAEPHYVLDSGSVVPAPVEDHHLARAW